MTSIHTPHPAGAGTDPDRMARAIKACVPDWEFHIEDRYWTAGTPDRRRRVAITALAQLQTWHLHGHDRDGKAVVQLEVRYSMSPSDQAIAAFVSMLRAWDVLPRADHREDPAGPGLAVGTAADLAFAAHVAAGAGSSVSAWLARDGASG